MKPSHCFLRWLTARRHAQAALSAARSTPPLARHMQDARVSRAFRVMAELERRMAAEETTCVVKVHEKLVVALDMAAVGEVADDPAWRLVAAASASLAPMQQAY